MERLVTVLISIDTDGSRKDMRWAESVTKKMQEEVQHNLVEVIARDVDRQLKTLDDIERKEKGL